MSNCTLKPRASGAWGTRVDRLLAASRCAIVALVLAVWLPLAHAHESPPTAFASLTIDGAAVSLAFTSPSSLAASEALSGWARQVARGFQVLADGTRCEPGAIDFVAPEASRSAATVNVSYRCQAEPRCLQVRAEALTAVDPTAHSLLRVARAGHADPLAAPVLLDSGSTAAAFAVGGADACTQVVPHARSNPGIGGFLLLGIEHILSGWDHLLFVLALVLPGGRFVELVRIITAFTLAHSVTLALAAVGVVTPPAAPVEALIAASIAWVAADNLLRGQPMSHRWLFAFGFGLVHGFGFSGVLREIGLPRDTLVPSLLSFNLGIELGQLVVVAALLPLLAWLRGSARGRQVPALVSAVVLAASLVLLAVRLPEVFGLA